MDSGWNFSLKDYFNSCMVIGIEKNTQKAKFTLGQAMKAHSGWWQYRSTLSLTSALEGVSV